MKRTDTQFLTGYESKELYKAVRYAVYTQFGEPVRGARGAAIGNVLKMHIEELLTKRVNDVLSGNDSQDGPA